eukprot:10671453-Ditylum_brightwellii.AAC.1
MSADDIVDDNYTDLLSGLGPPAPSAPPRESQSLSPLPSFLDAQTQLSFNEPGDRVVVVTLKGIPLALLPSRGPLVICLLQPHNLTCPI